EELFIEGTEPAEICPEGGKEGGPGVFDRALAWVRGALHDTGRWLAGLFSRGEGPRLAEQRERNERILGAPILPRAVEVRTPEVPPDLIGEPIDYEGPIRVDVEEAQALEEELRELEAEGREGQGPGEARDRGQGRGPPERVPTPERGDTVLILEPTDSGPTLTPVVVDTGGVRR
ncbi:MAG: hypothetical protein ACRELV_07855, partial [Longimicrobiales bacterium]